ncbi:hypothetical protein IW140_001377 [Coemansia sp. RSA 1813]|nr:hypothetical protein EV178_001023 [Coemansia sp. RSA 1646]KAJ1772236.1 hypothetical protein LPJ74_001666 [Coemansia sp. RSA 1843]KAJ2091868.1 hypothetical protein IW138_001557 [Coemansia sp. RSA 986]KAJ2215805.1 hypothetical protein EV179_001825 [Coemansia sp. RSA 487]KAJ2571736.1 hypothetical protein IW140_001377 [Coemansia sp. RSA 1813]
MVNLPLGQSTAHHHSANGFGTPDGSPQNRHLLKNEQHHQHHQQQQQQQQQQQKPSIEIRREPVTNSSPAKSRMLWREGFTPNEIENSTINEKEVKRQEVIFEIIHTEADYVKDLRIIVDILLTPMHNLKIVPANQIDLIFGNVREILELHESINHAFMERQRQQYPVLWDISDVLQPFVQHFRVYAKYICNQDNALNLVDELRRTSNNFAVFWKERQKRPECRNLPIESFLTLPFQRLLKYPLLLRTLLDATDGWTQQSANGRLVAEQVDAWIKKIQDARAKLDSYACLGALAKAVDGVDWTPLLQGEYQLMHSGPVKVTNPGLAANGTALPPEEAATMWLFDYFLVIARAEPQAQSRSSMMLPRPSFSTPRTSQDTSRVSQGQNSQSQGQGQGGNMPVPGMRYSLVMGPCQLIEVLELAQCRGSPAAYLKAISFEPSQDGSGNGSSSGEMGAKSSIVVRFASRHDYAQWRTKLDDQVRTTLTKQPSLSADILADAIARAKIIDGGPVPQCIGVTRRPPSSGFTSAQPSAMTSSNEIPTISVRDVYVQFPAARHKGKLRRGWDFLRSKTEDITGQGIKHQLKKYGGGGKRRATEAPVAMRRGPSRSTLRGTHKDSPISIARTLPMQQLLAPPLPPPPPLGGMAVTTPQSPSFVHVPTVAVPSVANGGKEASPARQNRLVRESRVSTIAALPYTAFGNSSNRLDQSMESVALKSYTSYSCRRSEDTAASSISSPRQFFPSIEFGSATLANMDDAASSVSGGPALTGRTLSMAAARAAAADMDEMMSDSEFSSSELSAVFPEHAAERSGSTLFTPSSPNYFKTLQPQQTQQQQRSSTTGGMCPRPLPIPPSSRNSQASSGSGRKPAPMFEFGSAKLTYGGDESPDRNTLAGRPPSVSSASTAAGVPGLKTWGTSAQDLLSSMPGFQSSSSLVSDPWQMNTNGLPARLPLMRGWQQQQQQHHHHSTDTDNNPSSANSTDSFCIVNHEPILPAFMAPRRRQSVGKRDDLRMRRSMATRFGGSSFEG